MVIRWLNYDQLHHPVPLSIFYNRHFVFKLYKCEEKRNQKSIEILASNYTMLKIWYHPVSTLKSYKLLVLHEWSLLYWNGHRSIFLAGLGDISENLWSNVRRYRNQKVKNTKISVFFKMQRSSTVFTLLKGRYCF